ncbi:GNAT family N-acetyltransferase [Actinomadura alba]|uniref:GNAT family N-acetyltransferase n=1 Tax=Actinomadura alba TaxID=406431 RepID=A0ABR7LSC1_9ACTN|nr:GNAT family N-acetyltransferase [Actinomadura alba]MBC6467655.1 GNAT family N-acetyltransferase [Actinomadura alba]
MSDIAFARRDGDGALAQLDELTEIHQQVYAEAPYNNAPKYGRHQFILRTTEQAKSPGFTLVTARDGRTLVGYAFGFTMPPGGWWACAPVPSPSISNAAKFAVIELLVLAPYRGHGIGRTLYDELLRDRDEPYATLAAVPEASAYSHYLRWGWQPAGRIASEPPYAEALVLALSQ